MVFAVHPHAPVHVDPYVHNHHDYPQQHEAEEFELRKSGPDYSAILWGLHDGISVYEQRKNKGLGGKLKLRAFLGKGHQPNTDIELKSYLQLLPPEMLCQVEEFVNSRAWV